MEVMLTNSIDFNKYKLSTPFLTSVSSSEVLYEIGMYLRSLIAIEKARD
ncbi:hypothetical protein [Clostridium sp.]